MRNNRVDHTITNNPSQSEQARIYEQAMRGGKSRKTLAIRQMLAIGKAMGEMGIDTGAPGPSRYITRAERERRNARRRVANKSRRANRGER